MNLKYLLEFRVRLRAFVKTEAVQIPRVQLVVHWHR